MKRGHACGRCGGPRRRGPVALIGDCGLCGTPLCLRHALWETEQERHVCAKCARKHHLTAIKVGG